MRARAGGGAGATVSVVESDVTTGGRALLGWQLLGVVLFLFIPLVLYFFVRQPEPLHLSLITGTALMVGHRFLARPYMLAVRGRKCLWCNGAPRPRREALQLLTGRGELVATVCPRHRLPAARFVAFLARFALPLRLGIFVPLLLLLVALAGGAASERGWLETPLAQLPRLLLPLVVAAFQLMVGLTVNFAAWCYPLAEPVEQARLPFPAHNFFLLGIRNLLWVFRLVGIWWIAVGAWHLARVIR